LGRQAKKAQAFLALQEIVTLVKFDVFVKQIRAITREYEAMEETLRANYETSVKQLDDFITSSTKIDGVAFPDLIDIVNDVIKSEDKVFFYSSQPTVYTCCLI
jgi:hypothetical protein